jgi:hypothetical protein
MPCTEIIGVMRSIQNGNAPCGQNLVFLNIKRGDALRNHCDLEGEALI